MWPVDVWGSRDSGSGLFRSQVRWPAGGVRGVGQHSTQPQTTAEEDQPAVQTGLPRQVFHWLHPPAATLHQVRIIHGTCVCFLNPIVSGYTQHIQHSTTLNFHVQSVGGISFLTDIYSPQLQFTFCFSSLCVLPPTHPDKHSSQTSDTEFSVANWWYLATSSR